MKQESPFVEIRDRLVALARALRTHERAKVESWSLGTPATDEDVAEADWDEDHEEEREPLPAEAVTLARLFNGAHLSWAWKSGDGQPVAGSISIASLGEIQDQKGPSPMEGETNWPLVSVSRGLASLVNDEMYFFDDDGHIKGENFQLTTVLEAIIDCLGIDGWELRFWDHGIDDEADSVLLEKCERRAAEIRTALGLKTRGGSSAG